MTNPYAPPKDIANNVLPTGISPSAEIDLSVEGDLIVCADNSTWPDRCVICNREAGGTKLTRKLFWHPGWIYLLILLNWLIYLVVALVVRKSGTVHISLCDTHRSRRTTGLLLLWIGFPLSFAAIFAGGLLADSHGGPFGLLSLFGLLGMFGFPIAGAILVRTVVPKRIHKGMLWLKAGKAFTDAL